MKETSTEVEKCMVFWKADPDLLLAFFNNCSSISHRSRVTSVFIPTGNDVITFSELRVCPVDMEMVDFESARPVRYMVVNSKLFSIFYRIGVIRCFISSWNYIVSRWGFLTQALKFDLVSTRPRKGTSSRQSTHFEPSYTFLCLSVQAVSESEKIGKKIFNNFLKIFIKSQICNIHI